MLNEEPDWVYIYSNFYHVNVIFVSSGIGRELFCQKQDSENNTFK